MTGKVDSLAELVLVSSGGGLPSEVLDENDPLRRVAGKAADFLLGQRPGRAFINADYDVDGTSSAAIIGGVLRKLGWDVRVFIPDRFEDAYGVNHSEIERVWNSEKFDLLIAADCGATEMTWLGNFGKDKGCRVMVIDHHKKTPHPELGVCEMNPQNHLGEGIHEYGYCTAVLAAMLAEAVAEKKPGINVDKFKILAGIAAMADVTSMRCPVARAYAKFFLGSKVRDCEPLDALAEVSKAPRPLESADALFKIIPMLNAAGRMRNATVLVALWDCDNYQDCLRVANRLWTLNRDRRRLQEEVVRKAAMSWKPGDRVLLAWHESWHPGVVGPAAGQLVERLGVPVFLGGFLPKKGCFSFSGRAPEGVDIHRLLTDASSGLPLSFGGHKVALGMRVGKADVGALPELKKRLNQAAPAPSKPKKQLSALLRSSSVNYVNYEAIRALEPFGADFPSPVFCVGNVEISLSPMGGIADSAAGIARSDDGHSFPVVAFKNPALSKVKKARGHAVGEMVCSRYEGEKVVKLLLKDFIPVC